MDAAKDTLRNRGGWRLAKLKGMDVRNQREIDSTIIELDGTNILCPRSDVEPHSILAGLDRLNDLLCDLLGCVHEISANLLFGEFDNLRFHNPQNVLRVDAQ